MKNMVSSCLLGLAILALGACSFSDKTRVVESNTKVAVQEKFNIDNLDKIEYIAETRGSYIGRYVDCKAGITIYTHSSGIATVPNNQINQDLIKEKCKQEVKATS